MTRRGRELELLFLTMFAAVPLYVTQTIGWAPLLAFHLAMAAIFVRVAMGRGPELIPAQIMRWLAIAYVPFYVVDAALISRGAIAASTHLVLFIAVYQPIESLQRSNHGQRLVTTTLIFVASLATSTHITIMLFVAAFALLMFRQLIYVSHLETVHSIDLTHADAPSARSAGAYLLGAAILGAIIFPFLPRLRNPFVQGLTGSLNGASTALSDTIDFSEARVTQPDTTVVARVWMDRETSPFFTPVRLRGTLYDRWWNGEWRQSVRGARPLTTIDGRTYQIARPGGTQREAIVQLRPQRGRLFLPVGTYAVSGVTSLYEGPTRESYFTYADNAVDLRVNMADRAEPLRLQRIGMTGYPISPEVEALAHAIAGNEQTVDGKARRIEAYLSTRFRYVANPGTLAGMSVDQFLLRERAGHCEYFAAGMTVLMNALGVPARIAGGFYGGRLNPLTGYYALRREDAHAWTEVWDGTRWRTYDSTPALLRPGSEKRSRAAQYWAALADSLTFFWDRYILTFGLGDQIALFTDLLEWGREKIIAARGSVASQFRALLSRDFTLLLATVIGAGFIVALVIRRRRPLFDDLAAHLEQHGVEVSPSMTVEEALAKLREADLAVAIEFEPLVRMYEEERFSARTDKKRGSLLRRKLAEL
jgi:transglutaminase-like putative cysteine protease